MIKQVENKLASFDRNPSTPTLLYKGISAKKNLMGGILGIGFVLLTLYLIITKGWAVWNKEDVNLISFVNRDMSKVAIDRDEIVLAVQLMTEDAAFILIPFSDYPKYGIWPHVLQISFSMSSMNSSSIFSKDPQSFTNIQDLVTELNKLNATHLKLQDMKPCSYIEGQEFLCSDTIQYYPQCSLSAMDFKSCESGKQYFILIGSCDPKKQPDCNKTLNPNLYPVLFVSDTKFNVLKKNSNQVFQQSAMAINNPPDSYPLYSIFKLVIDVPMTKLIIQSDQSLLPQSISLFSEINRTETYFYPQQQIGLVSTNGFWPVYMSFHLTRSAFTQTYYRSFPRFDSMLGQVFGLVGLISIIVTCCCSGYNDWLMKKHVSQNLKIQNRVQQENQKPKLNNSIVKYWKQRALRVCIKQKEQQRNIDLIKLCRTVQKLVENAGPEFQFRLSRMYEEIDQKNDSGGKEINQSDATVTVHNDNGIFPEQIEDDSQKNLKKSLLQNTTSKNEQQT